MTESRWQSYEEVATFLLNELASELGLDRVEGKQRLPGLRSGTSWVIDGKGVRAGNEALIIVECRRHTTSRQKQEHLGALSYRILDTGAAGGIIVTPLGLQDGAAKIASAEGITPVLLSADATRTDYILGFLKKLFAGVSDRVTVTEKVLVVERNVHTGRTVRIGDADPGQTA